MLQLVHRLYAKEHASDLPGATSHNILVLGAGDSVRGEYESFNRAAGNHYYVARKVGPDKFTSYRVVQCRPTSRDWRGAQTVGT